MISSKKKRELNKTKLNSLISLGASPKLVKPRIQINRWYPFVIGTNMYKYVNKVQIQADKM